MGSLSEGCISHSYVSHAVFIVRVLLLLTRLTKPGRRPLERTKKTSTKKRMQTSVAGIGAGWGEGGT